MSVGGQRHAPTTLTLERAQYPLYRRLGGPQGRSGRVRKISPPPTGFDSRTVQPIARRYTDWATPAHYRIPGKNSNQFGLFEEITALHLQDHTETINISCNTSGTYSYQSISDGQLDEAESLGS